MAGDAGIWAVGAVVGLAVVIGAATMDPPTPDAGEPAPPTTLEILPDPFRNVDPLDTSSEPSDADGGTPLLPLDPEPLRLPSEGTVLERIIAVLDASLDRGEFPGQFALLAPLGPEGLSALVTLGPSRAPRSDASLRSLAAVRALGDAQHARARILLRSIWDRAERTGQVSEPVRDALAASLYRQGDEAPLRELVRVQEAEIDAWPPTWWGKFPPREGRLVQLYLMSGQYSAAIVCGETAGREGGAPPHAVLYQAARAAALWEQSAQARTLLNRAITDGFDDMARMRRDGALRSLHGFAEFDYLCACALAHGVQVTSTYHHSEQVRACLAWLTRAAQRGYRITDQENRKGPLRNLRGEPRFERLWAAMGGKPE